MTRKKVIRLLISPIKVLDWDQLNRTISDGLQGFLRKEQES